MIDLRSDTVTRPTPAMRRAMFEAEVGDDVYGEDPTVNELERRAAEVIGKEAALFVPTGTMGNTIAIKLLTEHGQEVICDARAHLLDWELSMVAWFSGCLIRSVESEDGILTWDLIRRAFRPGGPHAAPTGAIEIENTHNMAGGRVYPPEVIDDICDHAHDLGVPVHMDGARIFNAAEATGCPVRRTAAKVDTVMFCLSKALGAPAGSMVAGPASLIDKGRLLRKRLGGAMRQAGVLAAAGLVALEESPKCLAMDHANAQLLAERLQRMDGIAVMPVETNIVIFDPAGTGMEPRRITDALRQRGVLMNPVNNRVIRAVTHYDVTRAQCLEAIGALEEVLGQNRSMLQNTI
jgi:threonine aldolase